MNRRVGKRVPKRLITGIAIISVTAWLQSSGQAVAAITAAPGYNVSVFAQNPANASSPDSIAVDGNNVYVGFGNGTKSDGSDNLPTTIAQYTTSGQLVNTFSVPGHNDGLRVDPITKLVYALQNQDGNPNLTTINSTTGVEQTYNLPSINGGGGYDDVFFLNGQTFIDAASPTLDSNGVNTNPVLATLKLNGSTATITPVLAGNTTAVDSATGQTVNLNLTDPDSLGTTSNGALTITGEGDRNLVTVTNPGTPQQQVSFVSHPDYVADDNIVAPNTPSDLLVADSTRPGGVVYRISGPFVSGTTYISAASNGFVGSIDTTSGVTEPIASGLGSPHGLAFTQPVPEPNSLLGLVAFGVLGVGLRLKRQLR